MLLNGKRNRSTSILFGLTIIIISSSPRKFWSSIPQKLIESLVRILLLSEGMFLRGSWDWFLQVSYELCSRDTTVFQASYARNISSSSSMQKVIFSVFKSSRVFPRYTSQSALWRARLSNRECKSRRRRVIPLINAIRIENAASSANSGLVEGQKGGLSGSTQYSLCNVRGSR